MKNIVNDKGITLVALAITIILIITIASIGISAGTDTISSAKYTAFQSELEIIQSKVNEISEEYQRENKQIGDSLTSLNQEVLNTAEVTKELNKKAGQDSSRLESIKNGFRLCTREYLANTFEIDGLTRDYLVNLEECIVVSAEKFSHEGQDYYMSEQMSNGLYNVTYNNQVSPTGTFNATFSKISNKYEINIEVLHEKYVSDWQVKYRLQGSKYWETTNKLKFEVEQAGTYEIQVVHENEIDLGTKTLIIN